MWIPLFLIVISAASLPAQTAEQTTLANDDHSMHQGHEMHMQHGEAVDDAAAAAKRLADKQESEFNHHLAGFFVLVGGLFMLAQGSLINRWSPAKYIWPLTFLLSGLFVLVWSDTELWPFHDHRWLDSLQNNPEVLQHKTFAVLLLALGCIEWGRVTGRLKGVWARLVFPVLAIGGSILLLFHRHEAGMHGPDHMEVMARIQSEHMQYAVVGIGLGIAKALAEIKTRGQTVFATLWPVFMIGLGILLMFYTE
jgi:putative copper resistance protein D